MGARRIPARRRMWRARIRNNLIDGPKDMIQNRQKMIALSFMFEGCVIYQRQGRMNHALERLAPAIAASLQHLYMAET